MLCYAVFFCYKVNTVMQSKNSMHFPLVFIDVRFFKCQLTGKITSETHA